MLRPIALALALTLPGAVGRAAAQPPAPTGQATTPPPPAVSASIANPAISVIGRFQGMAGNDPALPATAFELSEAELAVQAAVDPHSRAEFFLAAGPEGLDVEEGYLTWLALPGGGQARFGKFRADLGKFNRTHPPETPFADRPLAAEALLGAEGLAVGGVSASILIPNPANLYWDVIAQVGAAPDSLESPVFGPERRGDLLALGRTSVFVPFGESTDLNLGLSYASAPARPALRAEGDRAQLGAADLTLRWKNPRRSIYRSLLVQVELLGERGTADGAPTRGGGYGYAVYQFARRWRAGARYDRGDAPGGGERLSGALVLLQYQPSEFSTLSLQLRRVHDRITDSDRDAAFLKWTFNIGPHGAHPY
jgi:hypothetical protein